jgi:hypothetical protein
MNDQINRELRGFYDQVATEFLQTSRVADGYVGPFLVSCPKGYAELAIPWMYVGQEPFDWARLDTADGVAQLMDCHAKFNLAETYSGRGGPFWSFGYALDRKLNPAGPERSFIYSNLARIGKDDQPGRAPEELLEFWSRRRMLAAEVKLLSPRLVMLVTGPDYGDLLKKEFPGIDLPDLSVTSPVSQISHSELPALSFRSYHPKFLRLNGLEQAVLEFVASTAGCEGNGAHQGSK